MFCIGIFLFCFAIVGSRSRAIATVRWYRARMHTVCTYTRIHMHVCAYTCARRGATMSVHGRIAQSFLT